MKTLFIIMALALLGSCSPQLKNNSYKVGRSGSHWESKKVDRTHGKKGKKLTYYTSGWGLAAPCPVYGNGPVRRDVMKKYHWHRQKKN